MRTYRPLFGVGGPCDGRVSASPKMRSDLRIPRGCGTLQHVAVALVKPRDMP
jgi:hypothetical protein